MQWPRGNGVSTQFIRQVGGWNEKRGESGEGERAGGKREEDCCSQAKSRLVQLQQQQRLYFPTTNYKRTGVCVRVLSGTIQACMRLQHRKVEWSGKEGRLFFFSLFQLRLHIECDATLDVSSLQSIPSLHNFSNVKCIASPLFHTWPWMCANSTPILLSFINRLECFVVYLSIHKDQITHSEGNLDFACPPELLLGNRFAFPDDPPDNENKLTTIFLCIHIPCSEACLEAISLLSSFSLSLLCVAEVCACSWFSKERKNRSPFKTIYKHAQITQVSIRRTSSLQIITGWKSKQCKEPMTEDEWNTTNRSNRIVSFQFVTLKFAVSLAVTYCTKSDPCNIVCSLLDSGHVQSRP